MPELPETTGAKRRRATRACLSCRARKVRCNVSRSGPPCMNCTLDGIGCVVKARKPKSSSRRDRQPSPRHHREDSFEGPEYEDEALMEMSPQLHDVPATETVLCVSESDQLMMPGTPAGAPGGPPSNSMFMENAEFTLDDLSVLFPGAIVPPDPASFVADNWLSAPSPEPKVDLWEIPFRHRQGPLYPNSVVYTYYPFLTLDNLFRCLPQDVEFLEAEGCFHLPTRGITDQVVRQYFLHIHPLLPLFNEGDFWDMYQNRRSPNEASKMSLLVFQAILFVSCTFVNWSMDSAKSFGYTSVRGLRAAIYRRAKLLYDFGAETSPVAVAQAALLLSYWNPPVRAETKPNTVWLSVAIENAKNADAHYYATLPPTPRSMSASKVAEAKQVNILKRLWWCCVIRDRILPLGLRRGIQITRAHFDFEKHRPLGLMDLDDEIHRSMVYTPDAKRELIRLLSHVLDLCVTLTDVLLLVFPLDGALGQVQRRPPPVPSEETEIRNNKKALVHWYTSAVTASTGAGEGDGEMNWTKNESVILYTHLMYTYYHTARMALYHHELQHYLALVADNSSVDTQRLLDTRDAIQNAFSNITENLQGLNQRRLTRWLPISAAAYIAFPLALHVLNTHLASGRRTSSSGTLMEVMKVMHLQYDGVDWVAKLIRFLVDLVQDDPVFAGGRNVTDWADLLAVKPRAYLRLSLAMDLSMSSGQFPDKKDFLARLDSIRISRSARVLRSLAEPEQPSRVQEVRQALLTDNAGADDLSLMHSISNPKNGQTASAMASAPQRSEDAETRPEDVDTVPSPDPQDQPQASQVQDFGSDANMVQYSPRLEDLDEFFDHSMGDLTASEASLGQGQLGDYGADVDINADLLAG